MPRLEAARMKHCTSGSFSPIAITLYGPSVNLHTYSYPIVKQIRDCVQLCSLHSGEDGVHTLPPTPKMKLLQKLEANLSYLHPLDVTFVSLRHHRGPF